VVHQHARQRAPVRLRVHGAVRRRDRRRHVGAGAGDALPRLVAVQRARAEGRPGQGGQGRQAVGGEFFCFCSLVGLLVCWLFCGGAAGGREGWFSPLFGSTPSGARSRALALTRARPPLPRSAVAHSDPRPSPPLSPPLPLIHDQNRSPLQNNNQSAQGALAYPGGARER
jgi:hypothetical protein